MWKELREVFRFLSDAATVRAVILSGAGDRAFSGGLDVGWALNDRQIFNPSQAASLDGARQGTVIRRFALDFQECVSAIEQCEKRKSAVNTHYPIA
jgi:enoyl-CoA hydratase/carnithine racemase